jgi:hypothetical protein
MKKIVGLLTGVILSAGSFAQVQIGIQGTGNLATAQIKFEELLDYSKNMKALPGGGIVAQIGINKSLAIRTGVNFLQHGVVLKATETGEIDTKVKLENNLNYLQVPVNVLFRAPLPGITLYVGGGGFFNYGISGKSKYTVTYTVPGGDDIVESEKVDAFKKEQDGGAGLKKTDYGISALAGIQFGKLFANVGYQLSLANIAEAEVGEYKNRGLQLTIGAFF